jgi:hypothetical protein
MTLFRGSSADYLAYRFVVREKYQHAYTSEREREREKVQKQLLLPHFSFFLVFLDSTIYPSFLVQSRVCRLFTPCTQFCREITTRLSRKPNTHSTNGFFFFAYVAGLGHLLDRRPHLLMKETPFWMLSDSSFFAFSRPALHDSDV